jgi:sterol desaturase/sphingolipid hydroxylase (fatty acid hydroxylase superfamily)
MEALWDSVIVPLWGRAFPLLVWLVGLTALFVPLEMLFAAHSHSPLRRQWAVDLVYYFLNSLISATLVAFPLSVLTAALQGLLPTEWFTWIAEWPLGGRMLAGLFVAETGYYWGHRLSHEVPWLWRFHAIHHSAEELDYLVNTRAHPLDMVFSRLCALAPLYGLGLGSPVQIEASVVPIVISLLGTSWGFFVHANLRWRFGPLEWLVSTPAFHHWHHTRSGPLDRNFSFAACPRRPVWDPAPPPRVPQRLRDRHSAPGNADRSMPLSAGTRFDDHPAARGFQPLGGRNRAHLLTQR